MDQRHQFLLILSKSLDKYYFFRTMNEIKNVIKIFISWRQSEIDFLWAVKITPCTLLITQFYK